MKNPCNFYNIFYTNFLLCTTAAGDDFLEFAKFGSFVAKFCANCLSAAPLLVFGTVCDALDGGNCHLPQPGTLK